ncbi:SprT-like domain-containing protein [Spiroplasma endosymbiont of Crioceris asparagi]|uniref:SprT-like domain-containing protein n=1 Tax=Spiroplasma endosymbiont of Crioceris asparagi TaxID=3066286 RepID=UPI0030CAB519
MIGIDELILELTIIHKQLNKLFFNSELSDVKITIERALNRKRRKLGSFDMSNKWSDNLKHITIYTAALNANYYKIIEILLHEMCHQYNFENNLIDTENNGRHNKRFKKIGEKVLLQFLEPYPKYMGYAFTTYSDQLKFVIDNKLDFNKNVFKIVHKDSEPSIEGYSKRKTYKCKCGTRISNSNLELKIMCLECNTIFKY